MQGSPDLGEVLEVAPGPAVGPPVEPASPGLAPPARHEPSLDATVRAVILVVEYAIVASLLIVAGVVLVRTLQRFVTSTGAFPASVVPAVDGILAVIILLDIVQTVFRHLRGADFPVRPFLIVGILAAVRGILSASAHLTLATHFTTRSFEENIIELAVSVGVVLALLAGLLLLDLQRRRSGGTDGTAPP